MIVDHARLSHFLVQCIEL